MKKKLFIPEDIEKLEEKVEDLKIEKRSQNLIEELKELEPGRNVAFTAIEHLTEKADIKRFMFQYEYYLSVNGNEYHIRKSAQHIAKSNIKYILGYYSTETRDYWHKVLKNELSNS